MAAMSDRRRRIRHALRAGPGSLATSGLSRYDQKCPSLGNIDGIPSNLTEEIQRSGTAFAALSLHSSSQESEQMRWIFVALIASVLSILAFKYANNSLGGGELMASPMDADKAG
ncbi:hypothetical protein [Peteryoungia ipomoeae]|uniref:Uncharacterized protein n=1 Tax=Peteryoungia ipomoeae TaxID=1210932 RepID=A0A4S8P6Z7_9HYPH|nr:hypothetical protein [Peteryoungia ipomoeae]THV25145.1 hypothetical protein FAA97_02775 [Peteryoungia ipomoeae]